MPKVSVIIPCYNQAEFLEATLRSLQNQTLSDFECIVVDDGSTDNSASIVEDFARYDDRFFLLRKSNGGTATARNMGLGVAKGAFIQFLDADDDIEKGKMKLQVNLMEEKNLDVTFTDFLHFRESDGKREYIPHSKVKSSPLLSFRFALLTRWGVDFSLPPCAFLYKRDFLNNNNLRFSESIRYREDWDFHLSVSKASPTVLKIKEYVGAYYRMNPKGKTNSAFKISSGNMMYLEYKCHQLNGIDFLLLSYRLSCEILLLLGRCAKYRSLSDIALIGRMFKSAKAFIMLLIAIFLLPLTIIHIFLRTIVEYRL